MEIEEVYYEQENDSSSAMSDTGDEQDMCEDGDSSGDEIGTPDHHVRTDPQPLLQGWMQTSSNSRFSMPGCTNEYREESYRLLCKRERSYHVTIDYFVNQVSHPTRFPFSLSIADVKGADCDMFDIHLCRLLCV